MTNAEKKAFLHRYGNNEREIRRLEEEFTRWESWAQKITTSYSLAPAHMVVTAIRYRRQSIVSPSNAV